MDQFFNNIIQELHNKKIIILGFGGGEKSKRMKREWGNIPKTLWYYERKKDYGKKKELERKPFGIVEVKLEND